MNAASRLEQLDSIAKAYYDRRIVSAPPGSFDPRIENLEFGLFVLKSPPHNGEGGELSLNEWGHVSQILTQRYGFKFSLQYPPFSPAVEFDKLLKARMSGRETSLYRGILQEVSSALLELRRSYPIPLTPLLLRPTIERAHLPNYLSPLFPNDGPFVSLSLTQTYGGMDRLVIALEVISLTKVGQEQMREFLPLLLSGWVSVKPISQARALYPENFTGRYVAAAMYVPKIEYSPVTGHYSFERIIYVDERAELGILVDHLCHEIAHLADPNLHQAMIRKVALFKRAFELHGSNSPEDEMVRRHLNEQLIQMQLHYLRETENVAFAAEGRLKKELGEHTPGVLEYYYAHLQRGNAGPLDVTPQFIQDAYFSSDGRYAPERNSTRACKYRIPLAK